MRTAATIAALLACACSPSSKPASNPAPAAQKSMSTAELWALAPAGVNVGVVYGSGQGGAIERAMNEIIDSLRSTGVEIAALEKMISNAAALDLSDGHVPGFDPDRAMANFFSADDKSYSIARVTDRAAFRAALNGVTDGDVDVYENGERSVCEPKGDLYYCAPNVDALKAWSPGATPMGERRPSDLRGSVELFVELEITPETPEVKIYAAGRLERGRVSVDFAVRGLKQALPSAPAPLAKTALARAGNGFLQLNPALVKLAISEFPPDTPLVGGVMSALSGEVVSSFHAGGGELSIGVNDPAPFRALLSACDVTLPQLTARREGDVCLLEAPLPTGERLRARVRITDVAVVASFGAARVESKVELQVPERLGDHPWLAALWLRGVGNNVAALAPLAAHLDDRTMTLVRWGVAHLSEISVGFRFVGDEGRGFVDIATSWRNRAEVVAGLEPSLARIARGDFRALAELDRLAAANPRSALAVDQSLGDHRPLFAPAALAVVKSMTAALRQQETARDVVEEFEGIRAKMCDCEDRACADKVNAEFEVWLKANENSKGSRAQQERAKAIAEEYVKCMMSASGHDPAAAPDSP